MLRLIKQQRKLNCWAKEKNTSILFFVKRIGNIINWYYIQWIEEEKNKKISYFILRINIIHADNLSFQKFYTAKWIT